jgi:hypothetical protein
MNTYRTISADNDSLVEQVPVTTNDYLDHAIGALDERFGGGFAKANPNLVAAYMHACAIGLGTAFLARAIEGLPNATARVIAEIEHDRT